MRRYLVVAALALAALGLWAGPAGAAGGRTFTLELTGGPAGDPGGSGTATIVVNPGLRTVCYEIAVEGIDAPQEPGPGIGSAHIHFQATGGIAVHLEAEFDPTDAGFAAARCVDDVDRALLADIVGHPEDFYLNIHNEPFPGGALQAPLASAAPAAVAAGRTFTLVGARGAASRARAHR